MIIQRWEQDEINRKTFQLYFPFGFGDGGGGPTRYHIEYAIDLRILKE